MEFVNDQHPESPENVEPMVKRTVLIVDDDETTRTQLENELKRSYFLPKSVGDGKQALAVIKPVCPDLILLDVKLPDMDGIELLGKIKEQNPACQVIIMTGYGGEEIAVSALRKGAIDYLEKPLNMTELSAALGRAQEKLLQGQGLLYKNTILVTDDDEIVVDRIKRFLEKEGYMVFGATAADQGLEIIAGQKIDVVITDIKMQGMNGLEYLQKAKQLYPDIEGIVVTGHKTGEFAIEALRAGAIDYISKPIDLDELLFSVAKAIERIRLNRDRLFRSRELKITSEIIAKMNQELERRIEERSKELSKTQTQLFQTSKLATLGEMAAGLAHEINQPLGGISLVATHFRKLMERQKLTDKELESGIKDIEASVKRMSLIIQHIRIFARQESLTFKLVDLSETIASAMSLLGEQLRLHEIEVAQVLEPDLPKIKGEPYQLEQVWINLISNARDAMDEKQKQISEGKMAAAGYRKKLVISVSHHKDAKSILVSFADNGMGLSEENKKRVFEPFFTTKEVGKGTGLGLSISYGIIDTHKGRIEMDSADTQGTTIKVYLPCESISPAIGHYHQKHTT